MATTNFLLWNPSKNNQLTDSGYENNIMRSEGAPVGQILPSELANKLFYQCSLMSKAIADMMVKKGFDMPDTNLTFLVNALSHILTDYNIGTGEGSVCAGNDSRLMPVGAKMWFYANTALPGWQIVSGVGDSLLAVRGSTGIYTTGGVASGTWAQPSHRHQSAAHAHGINNHAHGINNHTHGISNHAHGINDHTHVINNHTHGINDHTHVINNHTHGINYHTHGIDSHAHTGGTLSIGSHNHQWFDYRGFTTDCRYFDSGGSLIVASDSYPTQITNAAKQLFSRGGDSIGVTQDLYTSKVSGGTTTGSTGFGGSGSTQSGGSGSTQSGGTSATNPGGNQDTSASGTPSTYRPLANVGIICIKL